MLAWASPVCSADSLGVYERYVSLPLTWTHLLMILLTLTTLQTLRGNILADHAQLRCSALVERLADAQQLRRCQWVFLVMARIIWNDSVCHCDLCAAR